jgi:hypothetical protein
MDLTAHAEGNYLNATIFRRSILNPRGLSGDSPVELIVDDVIYEQVFNPKNNRKTDEPVCYFRDVAKGMILSRAVCDSMIEAMGSGETNDWRGRSVLIYCAESNGKPCLRAKASASDAGVARSKVEAPLGPEGEQTLLRRLLTYRTRDGRPPTQGQFRAWLKTKDTALFERLDPLSLDSWPRLILERMAEWLRESGATKTSEPAPPPAPPKEPERRLDPDDIEVDEDIPF